LAFSNAKIFPFYLQFMNCLSSRFSCSEVFKRHICVQFWTKDPFTVF
jgi:hypothetical protein